MASRLWVLGAADPEMQVIEDLLARVGEQVAYAAVPGRDGAPVRVGPGQAYKAEGLIATDGGEVKIQDDTDVILVECGGAALEGRPFTRVDHHRPGDPGFGAPPGEYWRASSVGQAVSLLAELELAPDGYGAVTRLGLLYSVVPRGGGAPWISVESTAGLHGVEAQGDRWASTHTHLHLPLSDEAELVGDWDKVGHLVLAAAADHCLEAAYRGQCPGVDPGALGRWRAETRAAFQGRSADDVLRDVERAREALAIAPRVRIGDTDVADLRDKEVPELPEAACQDGVAYLAMPRLTERDFRKKVVLGAASPEVVRAFQETWASAQGLTEVYGDPRRGFAGGYVPVRARPCTCGSGEPWVSCPGIAWGEQEGYIGFCG